MPPRKTTRLPDLDLDERTDAAIQARIAQAEADLSEERVNMRWSGASLGVIRRAAKLAGVPYQTYVKQSAFRQALSDLRDAAAAGVVGSPG